MQLCRPFDAIWFRLITLISIRGGACFGSYIISCNDFNPVKRHYTLQETDRGRIIFILPPVSRSLGFAALNPCTQAKRLFMALHSTEQSLGLISTNQPEWGIPVRTAIKGSSDWNHEGTFRYRSGGPVEVLSCKSWTSWYRRNHSINDFPGYEIFIELVIFIVQ